MSIYKQKILCRCVFAALLALSTLPIPSDMQMGFMRGAMCLLYFLILRLLFAR